MGGGTGPGSRHRHRHRVRHRHRCSLGQEPPVRRLTQPRGSPPSADGQPRTSMRERIRMIEVRNLSKRYGDKLAVNHLSFTVEPGTVTGFLGPNGAGKSTTMRLIVGLDHPTSGTATIDGKRYAELHQPLRVVGALLEAGALHPGRSAFSHLLFLAQTQALPRRRVDEVIDLVGLHAVAGQRVGGFSLGMRQRLGIAAALLGDPRVLILDEPINGLDPEGILWVRNLLRQLADEGRTVLVSSHLMSEMAQTADNLIVIGRGSLIAQSTMAEFIEHNSDQSVVVRAPDAATLRGILTGAGGQVRRRRGRRADRASSCPRPASAISRLRRAWRCTSSAPNWPHSSRPSWRPPTRASTSASVEDPRPEADLVAADRPNGAPDEHRPDCPQSRPPPLRRPPSSTSPASCARSGPRSARSARRSGHWCHWSWSRSPSRHCSTG